MENLSDFFSQIGEEKKKNKEKRQELVGNLSLDDVFSSLKEEKKKIDEEKAKKDQEIAEIIKNAKVFENFLFSDTPKTKKSKKIEEEKVDTTDWRDDYNPTEIETVDIIKPEPLKPSRPIVDKDTTDWVERIEEEIEENKEDSDTIKETISILDKLKTKEEVQEQTTDPQILKIHRELEQLRQIVHEQGGGGEVRLEFLDDVDRDSVKTDGKVIAYQASTGTFIGVTNSGGGGGSQSLNQVLIEGNTSNLGMDVGIITATSFIGDVTGTASNASQLNNQSASYYLDYDNFTNTPTIPTNNNQLTNGAGYITTSFTNTNQLTNGAGFVTFTNTNQLTNGAGFVTFTDNAQLSNGAGYITTSFTNTNQLTNGAGFVTFTNNNQLINGAGYITGTGINTTGTSTFNNLSVSGVSTFTGNVSFGSSATFGDDDQIIMGDGPDMKMYHDGSNSYVEDTGTGALIMKGSTIRIRSTTNENMLRAAQNGTVELYHDNSVKFETTSSGAKVTGDLTVTGALSYDDVTNVDSVGLITARSGIEFGVSGAGGSVTSAGNATFAGTVTSPSLILDNGLITSSTSTKATTNQVQVDSFSATDYRSAKYQVQITRGSIYQSTEISVIHDGTSTYMTQYGTLRTDVNLATFSSAIIANTVRLLATPTSASSTVFKIVRTVVDI